MEIRGVNLHHSKECHLIPLVAVLVSGFCKLKERGRDCIIFNKNLTNPLRKFTGSCQSKPVYDFYTQLPRVSCLQS